MTEDDRELEYYRAVEDLFATLRGMPHTLSPKDFSLLREWWRDGIPLVAVQAGMTEVVARRREQGESEPVVSLSYYRHAVKRHAKHAAEMAVGAAEVETGAPPDADEAHKALVGKLRSAAASNRAPRPQVSDALDRVAEMIEAAADLPPASLGEHLFALESTLLANCLDALNENEKEQLEVRAEQEAASVTATPEARERTFRAFRDRGLRNLLGIPRLELDL
jgi:hypothetical protein